MAEVKRKIQKKRIAQTPKECFFCKEKLTPVYSDVSNLQKFTTDRGKIIGRDRSGLCAVHQRRLTSAIKHARHLALLPFVAHE
jgi:small subunit ribosomal protein S18